MTIIMSKLFLAVIALTALVVLAVAIWVFRLQTNLYLQIATPNTISPTPQEAVETREEPNILLKTNSTDKSKTDVYLKDKKTGRENLFITLTDVYKRHHHNAEYHQGNLYIIRRIGEDDSYQLKSNWMDELWRYNSEKQGTRLYSARGLDFRVSNSGRFAAITASDQLIVLDLQAGKPILDYSETQLKNFADQEISKKLTDTNISLWQWEKTRDLLWGTFNWTAYTGAFWKLDTASLKVEILAIPSEASMPTDLNTEKEVFIYTDKPFFFDNLSAKEWLRTHQLYSIYLYSLRSGKSTLIDTFPANWPEELSRLKYSWISSTRLRYSTPMGENIFTLKE